MSTSMAGKNVWWLYQARRVATQANVAGGAVTVDITVAAGQTAKLIAVYGANSGTNSLFIVGVDEDNNASFSLAGVGSAAANILRAPNVGSVGSASNNLLYSDGFIIGPGQKLSIYQSGAGAQNDTLTVAVVLLLSTFTEPTWDKSRSTNAADVTLAASTISAANTKQPVVL